MPRTKLVVEYALTEDFYWLKTRLSLGAKAQTGLREALLEALGPNVLVVEIPIGCIKGFSGVLVRKEHSMSEAVFLDKLRKGKVIK
jgi:hypothetical protein